MKDLRITKIVKEIKFEGIWAKLKAKNCFHRQSFTKYLRLTLVFMQNSRLRQETLIFVFEEFEGWALGNYSMTF